MMLWLEAVMFSSFEVPHEQVPTCQDGLYADESARALKQFARCWVQIQSCNDVRATVGWQPPIPNK